MGSSAAATARRTVSSRDETSVPVAVVESAAAGPVERVVRTVDMAHEFGGGWQLVRLASSFDGDWLVRLHGETVGSVGRVRTLSGRGVRGWEARHLGHAVPGGVAGLWPSRGVAMAAVVRAHQERGGAKGRRGSRRRPSR
ncbi:hypothetical protein GCM10009753_71320 [Streptantibioticus ferralitis]